MPTPTVAVATLALVGRGHCPKCLKFRDLYGLMASVVNDDKGVCRTADHKACVECLSGDVAPMVEVKVRDVVDLRTKNQRRKTNKLARKREAACAEEIGGHTTPGSGSGVAKGDARNDNWMIDDKHTKYRQYTVTELDVKKMIGDSCRTGRRGALKVGFRNGEGLEVAIMHWPDFKEMIDGEGD